MGLLAKECGIAAGFHVLTLAGNQENSLMLASVAVRRKLIAITGAILIVGKWNIGI